MCFWCNLTDSNILLMLFLDFQLCFLFTNICAIVQTPLESKNTGDFFSII